MDNLVFLTHMRKGRTNHVMASLTHVLPTIVKVGRTLRHYSWRSDVCFASSPIVSYRICLEFPTAKSIRNGQGAVHMDDRNGQGAVQMDDNST